MSVSPFDHPLLSGLLGDAEAAGIFSAATDLAAMLLFEAALAEAEAEAGVIPAEAGPAIAASIRAFAPDVENLASGTARDGVVVPALVAQLRKAVGDANGTHVHFGATSQDVVDTSLAIRLQRLTLLLATRLEALDAALGALDERDGAIGVMAHTRMQAAIPVTAHRKIASWRAPLVRARARLTMAGEAAGVLSFGGAAGTLDKLGDKAVDVTSGLAARLGLRTPESVRHSERDAVADYASALSLVTGALGKMGQDIALMAQTEMGEVNLATGGGSSAMPHKVNPVGAETLVALARFNATLLAGMHQSLMHENERSGAAWTLEWMLLPQMAVATAAALRTAIDLIPALSFNPRGPSA